MKKRLLLPAAAIAAFLPLALQAEIADLASDAGVATGSSGTANVAALFDNDNTTGVTFTTGTYITWNCATPYIVKGYTLTGGVNADTNPKAWLLEGSEDGAVWVQIDRKSAQTVAAGQERKITVQAAYQAPYRYFRFSVSAVRNSGTSCNIAELHLFGEKGETAAAPSDIRYKAGSAGVTLAWRDNSNNETGFVVERSLTGADFTRLAEVPANTTAYVDNNVPVGVGAIYRVCSLVGSSKSEYISTGVVRTGVPEQLPSVTANMNYTADGTNPFNANENGPKAVDGSVFTKYLSRTVQATLTVTLEEPVVVTQYAVSSANDAAGRDPRSWVVEASNDGSNWTEIDKKEDQYFSARYQTNRYVTQNTEAFSHYRLRVTANWGESITQLSEFTLFADIETRTEVAGLKAPADMRINVRTYNQVELTWTDNNEGEDCYVIERSTDGQNWDRRYITQPDDQKCYPYALKPNTTYYFRIASKAGETFSEWSAPVSATTPGDEWPETWPDFNFDNGYHTGNLVKVYSNDDIAIFVNPADVNAEGVSMTELDLSWMYEPFTKMWVAIRETYKNEYGEYLVSDPKLYIVPHYHADGGGLGRLYQYRDPEQLFRNIVHVTVGKNSGWRWERNPGNTTTNFLYDSMSHECGHIIEGVGSGYKNSPFYPVWLDSKWAEIFQYDIFGKMDPTHQAVWHNEYMQLGKHTEEKPAPGSEWYAKWLYPTYRDFGGEKLFQRFFALLGEHYFKRDGELQGNGNLGEYIHFMSGAAGVDVSPYAKDAFGWRDEWDMQLMEARNRYPGVTYEDAPATGNLLTMPTAEITAVAPETSTLGNVSDGDLKTVYDAGTKNTDTEWVELIYQAKGYASVVESYAVVAGSVNSRRAQAVELLGSNDGDNWVTVDAPESLSWERDAAVTTAYTFSRTLAEPVSYGMFKLRLKVYRSTLASLQVNEWVMTGSLAPGSPTDLRGEWTGSSVALSWSGPYKDLEKFEIERADAADGEFARIGEVDILNLTFEDEEAEAEKTYLYRVREIGGDFVSPYSNVLSVFTGESGVQTVEADASSIPAMLDLYQDNNVRFHTADGVCVVSQRMTSADWNACLGGSRLNRGVYIVTVDFNGAAAAAHAKVVIR